MVVFIIVVICVFFLTVGCNNEITHNNCPITTVEPTFDQIITKSLLSNNELKILFTFPIYKIYSNIDSNQTKIEEEETLQFNNSFSGSLDLMRVSTCSFVASRYIPNDAVLDFQGNSEMTLNYYSPNQSFSFPFLFDYRIKNHFNIIPQENTIGIGVFQILNFYEETDSERYEKVLNWEVEVLHYGDIEISFIGLHSGYEANYTVLKTVLDNNVDLISYVTISILYGIDEEFESETLLLDFQKVGEDGINLHFIEIRKVHSGFVSSTPIDKKIVDVVKEKEFKGEGIFEAYQTFSVDSRSNNQSFSSISVSSTETFRITNILNLKEEVKLVNFDIISLKALVSYISLICENCVEETRYTFDFDCGAKDYYSCIHHSREDDLKENVTLNIENISPGNYRVESRFVVIVSSSNRLDRRIILETFSQMVVSSYLPIPTIFEIIIIVFGTTLGLFATAGGLGIGLFVMRVMKKQSDQNRYYKKLGRQIIDEKGNKVQMIDLNYSLRHKDIKIKEEDEKGINKTFAEILKVQKASKYTPYVHCKYCYLEQIESEIGNICCKCGIPLLNLIEFKSDEKFCALCAMMNKYQPRPHGRCLLHLSNSKNNDSKQGAVYVLYKDHYSIGSASRQLKKCNKNSWIERVTKPEVWKLNSLLRYEFVSCLKNLVRKELYGPTADISVLKSTMIKIIQKYHSVGPGMKSDSVKKLKIELNDGSFSKNDLNKYYKHLKKNLKELVDVLTQHIKYVEKENRNREENKKKKKRKRKEFQNNPKKKVKRVSDRRKEIIQFDQLDNILTTEELSVQNNNLNEFSNSAYESETSVDSPNLDGLNSPSLSDNLSLTNSPLYEGHIDVESLSGFNLNENFNLFGEDDNITYEDFDVGMGFDDTMYGFSGIYGGGINFE